MLTPSQQRAVDPTHSVWVGASAGTGKTKVLTDRVLRLLLDGVSPSNILCITFTNAAACEMASRIRARLADWAILPDAVLRANLEQLLSAVPAPEQCQKARQLFVTVLDAEIPLRIQTIHSFCQSVVQRFPVEAGVLPGAELADEADQQFWKTQALHTVLGGVSEGPLFLAVEALMARVTLFTIEERYYEAMGYRSHLQRWSEDPAALFQSIGAMQAMLNVLDQDAEQVKRGLLENSLLNGALLAEWAECIAGTPKKQDRVEAIHRYRALPENASLEARFDAFLAMFQTQSGSISAVSSLCAKTTEGKGWAGYERFKDGIERLKNQMELLGRIEVAEASAALMQVASAAYAMYQQIKAMHGALDYDDLLHVTDQVLSEAGVPWVLYKLDGEIHHLLVDEAQDTSPLQWRIIRALTEEFHSGDNAQGGYRSLFVVGDEKQSIYGFQGAEPAEFGASRQFYAERFAASGKSWQHLSLDTSFRSSAAVLTLVDELCNNGVMKAGLTVSEQAEITHKVHRNGHAGKVVCWPCFEQSKDVNKDADGETSWILRDYDESVHVTTQMADVIARQIRRWLDDGRALESKGRPVRPSDILILVRQRGGLANPLLRALKRYDVPVAGADRLVLQEHILVQDMLALCEWLLDPAQDYALACFLKSPFCDVDEALLFALAHGRGDASLWSRLRASDAPQAKQAADMLERLLSRADFIRPYALISLLLQDFNGRAKAVARLGEEAHDPLDEFLNQALAYEQHHPVSLQGFWQMMQQSRTTIKREAEQGGDVVRLMTVHGAKGLQAPIVILPDCGSTKAGRVSLLEAESHGTPFLLWQRGDGQCDETEKRKKARNEREALELHRLLYVALTRAEDELYVTARLKGKEKEPKEEWWYSQVRDGLKAIGGQSQPASGPFAEVGNEEWCYAVPQTVNVAAAQNEGDIALPPMPAHMREPATIEPVIRWASPSRVGESERGALKEPELAGTEICAVESALQANERGTVIHLLLEHLLPQPRHRWAPIAMAWLEQNYPDEISAIHPTILRVAESPHWQQWDGGVHYAEVPVMGRWNEHYYKGQVDLVVQMPERIWIIDYKTSGKPPEANAPMPQAYRQQLEAYAGLLAPEFGDLPITTVLWWTENDRLQYQELADDSKKMHALP